MATPYRLGSSYLEQQYDCSRNFVGRHDEREKLKIFIKNENIQLIQVYGLPYVGKTRLIKVVCQELKDEIKPEILHTKHIHISKDDSWSDIFNKYDTFAKCPSASNTKWKICIFDDFQNIQEIFISKFQDLCDNDFPLERDLKIILILSGGEPFQFDGISFGKCKVSPLLLDEGQVLFSRYSHIVEDNTKKQQIHNIIRHTCGLPGLLIDFAQKISQFQPDFSFNDIYKMICDDTNISDWLEECKVNQRPVKQEMDKYLSQLSHKQQEAIKVLSYFPGQFGIEEVVEMTNSSSYPASKTTVLMPLVEQGLINSDLEFENFQVQELIRAIVSQQIDNVSSNDLIKLKFSNIIGKSLMKAEDIYHKGFILESLGIMKKNWENISYMMKKGIEAPSDGQTYAIYYDIAFNAGNILMMFHPKDSKQFFQSCLQNSMMFGNEQEQAFMNIAYGVSVTNLPGYGGYKEAMMYYKKALSVLKSQNIQYRQMLLYNSMAYNSYMQGNYVEALEFSESGYNMTVSDASSQMVQHGKISCASTMAYNLSFIGHYDRCEEILKENLKKISDFHHPSFSAMLNTMGINYVRNGSQTDKAFHYYNASLMERLKIISVNPKVSVISYCNVALLLSRNYKRHGKALSLLLIAKDIQEKQGWLHMNTSLVLHYIAQVYMRKYQIPDCLNALLEALSIYNQINPNYLGKTKVIQMIAHCYLLREEFESAKKYFQDILEVEFDNSLSCVSETESVLMALEHLTYLNFENPQNQMTYLENLLKGLRQHIKQSVNDEQKQRYSNGLGKYHSLKISLIDKLDQLEERAGLYINSLPVICYFCINFKSHVTGSPENYVNKLCGLRSNTHDLNLQRIYYAD